MQYAVFAVAVKLMQKPKQFASIGVDVLYVSSDYLKNSPLSFLSKNVAVFFIRDFTHTKKSGHDNILSLTASFLHEF